MKKNYDLEKLKRARKGPAVQPKDAKVQTTIRLDGDLFVWLQKRAAEEALPYQTLLNQLLREAMGRPSVVERLKALEAAVFKKHG